MRVVDASYEILPRDGESGNIKTIEIAARTCYKSEDKITMFSYAKLVEMLIEHHHEAMLEHGDYIFQMNDAIYKQTVHYLNCLKESTGSAPMLQWAHISQGRSDRHIISGNIRAWREFLKSAPAFGCYYGWHMNPIYTKDLDSSTWGDRPDERVKRITEADLVTRAEKMTHARKTVRFTVDRGVSHEIVRHRLFSFAQESTRYCNYAKGKFSSEITVINPCYMVEGTSAFNAWASACYNAQNSYFTLLELGCSPQEARAVLPTSLKTDLIVTGNLTEWKHFFDLRAKETTGKVHPQMLEVAMPLYEEFLKLHPEMAEAD